MEGDRSGTANFFSLWSGGFKCPAPGFQSRAEAGKGSARARRPAAPRTPAARPFARTRATGSPRRGLHPARSPPEKALEELGELCDIHALVGKPAHF